jgi:small ligand-binding sensory domain FIST
VNAYAATLATDPDLARACERACADVRAALGGAAPDLAFVFASPAYDRAADAGRMVRDALGARTLIGAVANGGVIGAARELEDGPGLAVLAGAGPALAGARTFHARFSGHGVDVEPAPLAGTRVVLADPYTMPAEPLLAELGGVDGEEHVVGGLAGGLGPGQARLFLDGEVLADGAVGVVPGDGMATLVSQGCRPLGPDLVVTAAQRNVILELAGSPALERLRDVLTSASPEERELAEHGLLGGIVVDENLPDYGVGDYLVRVLAGVDRDRGSLAIGAVPRVGQTFRFHVRDEASADAELREVLATGRTGTGACLLFACNGRGSQMFSAPDHDARLVDELLGVPAVGLFCQGEIGPVGGANHLHGFTATVALFPD